MKPVKKQTIVKIYQYDSLENPNAYQTPVKVFNLNGFWSVVTARRRAARAVKYDKRLLYCTIQHVCDGFTVQDFGRYAIL